IMLQWNDGSWEHRAFWGADNIDYGTSGTAGRAYMGGLPTAGQWVLLQVPASQVGLEGSTVSGMAFSQYYGSATWDYAGKAAAVVTNALPTNSVDTNTVTSGGTNSVPSGGTNNVPTTGGTNDVPTTGGTNDVPTTGTNNPPVTSTNAPLAAVTN